MNGFLIQAQVDGWARDVAPGSHLSVRGELSVIACYEWDSFGLVDTRGSRTVPRGLLVPDPSPGCNESRCPRRLTNREQAAEIRLPRQAIDAMAPPNEGLGEVHSICCAVLAEALPSG